MKYRILFKDNKVRRYESKDNFIDRIIPLLVKYDENNPELTSKQQNIIKYAKKHDRITLICGNYSVKDIVSIFGGKIL